MATYGVTYGGARNPHSYGVGGRRTLSSMYAGSRPSLGASFNPISDTLSSLQAQNQGRLNTIAPPQSTQDAAAAFRLANAPAPAAPSPPPVTPAGAATGAAGRGTTDLSADPILTQIKALGQRGVQDAAYQGTAGSKNDLINYGSVNVPQSLRDLFATQTPTTDAMLGDLPGNPVLAALNDAGTATAASGNPFSILKQLSGAHDTNVHGIDQATNLANLYYSSTHANQLGQENQNYLGSQNTAANNLASLLSGENSGFLNALGGAHDQYLSGLPAAYQRALDAGGSGATGTPDPGSNYVYNPDATQGGVAGTNPAGAAYGFAGQPILERATAGVKPKAPPVSANLARLLYGN